MADPYIVLPGARLYMGEGRLVESVGAYTGPGTGPSGRAHVHEYSCSCPPSLDGACNCSPLGGVMEVYQEVQPALAIAGTAAGAYHGYKRTKSVGWALAWSVAGAFFPLFTGAVALAQGFGKPKK